MHDDMYFTAPGRDIYEENRIELVSVGVDIGSSTSLLVFSRIELERQDSRYVPVKRTILSESEIFLTPYIDETTIDGATLGRFIDQQYTRIGLKRTEVDTGALILTGVSLYRQNARAIGDLFSQEAGRFVAVSAGDNLETTMAAYGSGAVPLSEEGKRTLMNVDIGGGTTKIAVCQAGKIIDIAALDIGARLLVWDGEGRIVRLEAAGRRIGRAVGLDLEMGRTVTSEEMQSMASYMADCLMEIISLSQVEGNMHTLLRTPPLAYTGSLQGVVFSGGVSEYIYGNQTGTFGDLGPLMGKEISDRVSRAQVEVLKPKAGIRATVIGASQYVVQVSGSTIFLSPLDVVPIRNLPVLTPNFLLGGETIDPGSIRESILQALHRFDLADGKKTVALAFSWEGSATYQRIQSFCCGIAEGMKDILNNGNPLVLVNDGDVGGLFGIHLKEDMGLANPIISIDGIDLKEFDFIDIGDLIASAGAVPVVIKSLMFSSTLHQPAP